jgi:hypothetical protein
MQAKDLKIHVLGYVYSLLVVITGLSSLVASHDAPKQAQKPTTQKLTQMHHIGAITPQGVKCDNKHVKALPN